MAIDKTLLRKKEGAEFLNQSMEVFEDFCKKNAITPYKTGTGKGTRYYYSKEELERLTGKGIGATPPDEINVPIYSKLNREQLRIRMSDSFPSVYLTMISIIQGVAFGFLINTYFEGSEVCETFECFFTSKKIEFHLYAFFTFLTIVSVTFE
ncbi:MAG: hypothetical protein R3D00_05380 [Bacteroidia bacterium]